MNNMLYHSRALLIALAVALSFHATAITITPTTLNFDGLPDSSAVGNTYSASGVHFNNAIALTAGVSLNEISFPPHSGTGVITDNGSPILITFDSLASSISAYFAYNSLLTFTAFDGNGGLLGTQNSPFNAFLGGNQLISLGFSGVSSLQISAQASGTYILDDLSFQPGSATGVPDPGSTLPLLALASLVILSCALVIHRKSNEVFAAVPILNEPTD